MMRLANDDRPVKWSAEGYAVTRRIIVGGERSAERYAMIRRLVVGGVAGGCQSLVTPMCSRALHDGNATPCGRRYINL